MKLYRGPLTELRRIARKGFRGYPVGSVAAYGPTDQRATKLAVGIVLGEGQEPCALQRWYSESTDARSDEAILTEVLAFVRTHRVKSVAMPEQIIGCPHEEGKDYPVGIACPMCPFWEGRDRWGEAGLPGPTIS